MHIYTYMRCHQTNNKSSWNMHIIKIMHDCKNFYTNINLSFNSIFTNFLNFLVLIILMLCCNHVRDGVIEGCQIHGCGRGHIHYITVDSL